MHPAVLAVFFRDHASLQHDPDPVRDLFLRQDHLLAVVLLPRTVHTDKKLFQFFVFDAPKKSRLTYQIRLAPVNAPYFNGADLLIAADCTAYAYGDFHQRFMKDHVTLIGCPKLDPVDYSEKLSDILRHNDIRSLTIVRMEVPCCGGIERAATAALDASGKHLPCQVVTIGMNGRIKE